MYNKTAQQVFLTNSNSSAVHQLVLMEKVMMTTAVPQVRGSRRKAMGMERKKREAGARIDAGSQGSGKERETVAKTSRITKEALEREAAAAAQKVTTKKLMLGQNLQI